MPSSGKPTAGEIADLLANALKSPGVAKGGRVAIYMPMVSEIEPNVLLERLAETLSPQAQPGGV
jgi:hypothetical protein